MPALSNNEKIGTLAEESNERFAQQPVLNQEKRADGRAGDRFVREIHFFLTFPIDEEDLIRKRMRDLAVDWTGQNKLDSWLLSSKKCSSFINLEVGDVFHG
jgi:hypothetical protein